MGTAHNNRVGRRIRSVEIAFSILEAIRTNDQMTVTKLAEALGHSKSTIHSHLRTLEEQEIIVRHGDSYRLSLQVLDLANDVCNQIDNYDVIVAEVNKLSAETGEIAQFGLEEHGKVAYLYKSMGDQAVETASRAGGKQPIYSTSLGKAIVAFLPSERQKAIVDAMSFEPKTPKTITSPEKFYEELATITERGTRLTTRRTLMGSAASQPPSGTEIRYSALSASPDRRVESRITFSTANSPRAFNEPQTSSS